MNTLPTKLLALRKQSGYSQSYVAEYLNKEVIEYMGYENGRSVPSFSDLKKLAKLYKVKVDDLFINERQINYWKEEEKKNDTQNITYLEKQTKKTKRKAYLKTNQKVLIGISVSLVLIVIVAVLVWRFAMSNSQIHARRMELAANKLDASNTTVVYINELGGVNGLGDNMNGQLDQDFSDVFKVQEGSNFTVVLKNDGTLEATGLDDSLLSELERLEGIVDIASGNTSIIALNEHGDITCLGDESFCDFPNDQKYTQVFASYDAYFALDTEGVLHYDGRFAGSSRLDGVKNVKDVAANENILAYVTSDGRVFAQSTSGTFGEVSSWRDINEIAIGNDYIAGLDASGQVHFAALSKDAYSFNAESFSQIETIDGGIDYFIAYDGMKVIGIGNDAYDQFENVEVELEVLASVSNIAVSVNTEKMVLEITFDEVANATSYEMVMNDMTYTSNTNLFEVSYSNLQDGYDYDIEIIAKGDNERYSDSLSTSFIYTYEYPIGEDVLVLSGMIGMNYENLERYLVENGANSANITGIARNDCSQDDSEGEVVRIDGLEEGEEITRNELGERTITYYYCVFEAGDSDENVAN